MSAVGYTYTSTYQRSKCYSDFMTQSVCFRAKEISVLVSRVNVTDPKKLCVAKKCHFHVFLKDLLPARNEFMHLVIQIV